MATYPELTGKVAVISGAGGNLGITVIKRFHDDGVRMALIDRSADSLRQRLVEAGLESGIITIGPVDLRNKAAVDAFVEQVAGLTGGQIDILVNLAGGFKAAGPVHEMDEATWDDMMTLNAKTAFLLSGAVARQMVGRGAQGRIISVAARGGLRGNPGISAYSASKSALIRLTESMAGELLDKGITVNAVLPSTIDTASNRQNDPKADFSRWVKPESLADVIVFLASDAARDISGASIPVYGRA